MYLDRQEKLHIEMKKMEAAEAAAATASAEVLARQKEVAAAQSLVVVR